MSVSFLETGDTNVPSACDTAYGWLIWAEELFLKVGMGLLTVVVSVQIVSRNVGIYVSWCEDLALLIFTWLVFVGAAVAVRQGGHYLMDVWGAKHRRWKRVLCLFAAIAIAVYTSVLIWQGFTMAWLVRGRESGAGGIGMSWYFVGLPLASILSLVHLVHATRRDWERLKG